MLSSNYLYIVPQQSILNIYSIIIDMNKDPKFIAPTLKHIKQKDKNHLHYNYDIIICALHNVGFTDLIFTP